MSNSLPKLCLLCEHAVGLLHSGKPFKCEKNRVPLNHRMRDIACFTPMATLIQYKFEQAIFPDGVATRKPWWMMVDEMRALASEKNLVSGIVFATYETSVAHISISLDGCDGELYLNCRYFVGNALSVPHLDATVPLGAFDDFIGGFKSEEAFQSYLRKSLRKKLGQIHGHPKPTATA